MRALELIHQKGMMNEKTEIHCYDSKNFSFKTDSSKTPESSFLPTGTKTISQQLLHERSVLG